MNFHLSKHHSWYLLYEMGLSENRYRTCSGSVRPEPRENRQGM